MTLVLILQMIWMAGITHPAHDTKHIKMVAREAVRWYIANYRHMKEANE